MSVTLKTEHGEFTAETVKECEKLARKAERDAAKADKAREERQGIARQRAQATGYRILAASLGGGMSGCWSYVPLDELTTADAARLHGIHELKIETEDGTGTLILPSLAYFAGLIQGASGYALAIHLAGEGTIAGVYAVGTHDGEAVTVDLPGVSPADFALHSRPAPVEVQEFTPAGELVSA